MADLAEIMAELKQHRGYIYVLSLPQVPEIIKITGRKEDLSNNEIESEEGPFVVESKHCVDFYEKALKWIFVNMSEDCISYRDGIFKTSVKQAQYVIMIKSRGIGNVSYEMETLIEKLVEINKIRYSDIIERLENAIKNRNEGNKAAVDSPRMPEIDDPAWNDIDMCIEQAKRAYFTEDMAKAELYYKRSIELGNIDGYREIGDIFRLSYGKIDDAISWYEKGIAAGDFRAYVYLGTAYLSLDKIDLYKCIDAWEGFSENVIKLVMKQGWKKTIESPSDIPHLYYHMIMQVIGYKFFYHEKAIEILTSSHNHKILIGMCFKKLLSLAFTRYKLSDESDLAGMMALSEKDRDDFLAVLKIIQTSIQYFLEERNQFLVSTWPE